MNVNLIWNLKALFIIFTLVFICIGNIAMAKELKLDDRIGLFNKEWRDYEKDFDTLHYEAEYLKLLKEYTSPTEKGKIFMAVANTKSLPLL
ncbi:MAG: hypothetical protein KKH94_02675 [Candidatus Omnitrophica bacterium]|nr:hypothetical protein [Candidatus Omnitrophota bacterium]